MSDGGWWNREPDDLWQGCAVILAGVLLGWGAVALTAWALIAWWGAR